MDSGSSLSKERNASTASSYLQAGGTVRKNISSQSQQVQEAQEIKVINVAQDTVDVYSEEAVIVDNANLG